MKKSIIGYFILDTLCTGVGMGVPFFNILLGFLVGWYVVRSQKFTLHQLFRTACQTSLLTLIYMGIIWLPKLSLLSGSPEVIANFGIPQILYEPRASFIGWIVLMVVISPFLQLLTTLFSGNLVLIKSRRGS